MIYKQIDCCPVPKRLYPILVRLKKDIPGLHYNSLYRGNDARDMLHACGKHTQAELYKEGYPANPPGVGSHVLHGDGTYGVYGDKLEWWQLGIDINDEFVKKFIHRARHYGWDVRQPYSSASEYHHVNFFKKPARWRYYYRKVFG